MPLSKFRPARLPVAVAAALLSAYSFGQGDGVEQVDLPTVQVKGIGKQTTNNYTIPASSAATGIRLTQARNAAVFVCRYRKTNGRPRFGYLAGRVETNTGRVPQQNGQQRLRPQRVYFAQSGD